jgi:perosamine synthetase
MIPVNEPWLTQLELGYVAEAVQSGWISSAGRYIDEFERRWAEYCGVPFGIAVANGTVALEIAVECLGLEPGDEVILPSFTIISCAGAIVRAGGVPVLVDADPHTWCMDVNQVADRITPRTRAIMPVHIYGHPVEMDPLWELAEAHGLRILEDAAEAHGALYRGRRCGGLGDIGCFSFYANKIITTGEGGMVLTGNPAFAERARSLRNLCFRPERRFYHTELGHNFRLTNLQAALGVGQLERIEELLAHKRWMGQRYGDLLSGIPGLALPVERPWATNVYWMYGLVLDEDTGLDAVTFARELKARGVDTRPFFLGMHEQPVFHQRGLFAGERYPVTERLARQGLYLPSGLTLTAAQMDTVVAAVRDVLEAAGHGPRQPDARMVR